MKHEPLAGRADIAAIKEAALVQKKSLRAICKQFHGLSIATLSRFLKSLREADAAPQDEEVGASDIIAMLKVLRRAIAHAKRKRDTNTILKCSSELRALLALRVQLNRKPSVVEKIENGEQVTTISERPGKGDLAALLRAVEEIYDIRIPSDPRITTIDLVPTAAPDRKLLKQ